MIDPEYPVFREGSRYSVIDFLARGEIGAERLFQPDPDVSLGQPGMDETVDCRLEQAGCGRQEDRQTLGVFTHLLGQRLIPPERGRIDGHIAQPIEKLRDTTAPVFRKVLFQRRTCEIAIGRSGHFRTCSSDHPEVGFQQPIGVQRAQGR